MLLFQNTQHLPAFTAILDNCTAVRAYEITHEYNFNIKFVYSGGFDHDDITGAMAALWQDIKTPVRVPLGGAYYASIKPTISGKYAAFDIILTSNDKRRNTSLHTEHYNVIGGYWYTSQADLNKTGNAALQSKLMTSLTAIVRAFNRANYVR